MATLKSELAPWALVDTAAIPGERDTMRLMQRGEEFSIMVGQIQLMNNGARSSEQALGTFACERLRDRLKARVLIGGLGMGFTLRAALETLGPSAKIVVAELIPAVAAWARGPLAHLFAGSLDDPRVDLRVQDVNRTIQSGPATYDAILLDVDNGPEGLTQRTNDNLCNVWGLKRARFALRDGGILAVWSVNPSRKFKARLELCGFSVEQKRVLANGAGGRRHMLWLATRPSGSW